MTQAIADGVFEAYLDLLPPELSGRPLQRQRPSTHAADGYAGLQPLSSGRDQLAEVILYTALNSAPYSTRYGKGARRVPSTTASLCH